MKGILIISHGSPEPSGTGTLRALAQDLRSRFTVPLELAFLDFNQPDIPSGVELCYQQGIRELLLIPYFLTEGYLMKKSIRLAEKAAGSFSDLQTVAGEALVFNERIGKILLDRYSHAVKCFSLDL